MFEGAEIKLQDARTAIRRLRAMTQPLLVTNIQIKSGPSGVSGELVGTDDPVAFSEAFSSCVAQVRSVGDAVLKDKDANKLSAFRKWRETKKDECKNDDLMKFINDRRNDDLHEGDGCLSFTMHPYKFSSEDVGTALPPGAVLRVSGTGAYWIAPATPDDRHPCAIPDGAVFTVAIIDAPTVHKGKPLTGSDPVTICATAERYYTELLREARRLFE